MGQESRAEKLACEALDAETDEDWQTAADRWERAAAASTSRKKEYRARAEECAKRAPKRPEPTPDDKLEQALESSIDIAIAERLESEGKLVEAAEYWEKLAELLDAPEDKQPLLVRARRLRELVAPPRPPPLDLSTYSTAGAEAFLEASKEVEKTTINLPPIKAGDTIRMPDGTIGRVVETKTVAGETIAPEIANAPPYVIDSGDRDPRLPPPGEKLRREFADRSWLEVAFGTGNDVTVTAADRRHATFVGKTFDTPSTLGRAWRKKNTNGYDWLGLTTRKSVAERLPPRATALLEQAMSETQALGYIPDSSMSIVRRRAVAIALRQTAELFADLADVFDRDDRYR